MAQQTESKPKTKDVLTHEAAVRNHGYPVMKNTGNPNADYLSYKNAKIEWKAKNPGLYKQMHPKKSSSSTSARRNYKKGLQKSSINK